MEALKRLGLWPKHERTERRIVAEYNYTDAAGNLLYQVVRTEPKGFLQRYPDGAGGWIWKKYPKQVLYHLRQCWNRRSCSWSKARRTPNSFVSMASLQPQTQAALRLHGRRNLPWPLPGVR
jgi:hypothetical protein